MTVFGRRGDSTTGRALRRRAAVIRAVERGWIWPATRRAAAAVTALDRGADVDHHDEAHDLRRSLALEADLLSAIWKGRIDAAATAYRVLVEHHGTQPAGREAYARLPADIRGFGPAAVEDELNPLAFAMPFSLFPPQRRLLLAALPELRRCPHGRWRAHGTCRCVQAPTAR